MNRSKEYIFYGNFTCKWEASQENEDLKKWPEKEAFISFRQRNEKFVKNSQDKGVGAMGSK